MGDRRIKGLVIVSAFFMFALQRLGDWSADFTFEETEANWLDSARFG
jgi:hypothetical protein